MKYLRYHSFSPLFFFVIFLSFILSGCGKWPRFIVLKDPLTIEEHLTLGSAYESKGETEFAIKEYKAALSKDKKSAEALFFLGNAYFGAENLDKSEYFYKKALKVHANKQGGLIHNNLAWIYIKRGGNLSKAAKLCKEAIKLDPNRSSIYLDTLGVVYFFQEKYKLAEQALLDALEKVTAQSTVIRGEILTNLSEVNDARKASEREK